MNWNHIEPTKRDGGRKSKNLRLVEKQQPSPTGEMEKSAPSALEKEKYAKAS